MQQWNPLVLVVTVLALSLGGCAARVAQLSSNHGASDTGVVVAGEGKTTASPDRATIRVGVEVHRPTMAEARSAAAEAQGRILAAVRALGVAEADVQTDQLSFGPDYEYGEGGRRLRGYVATNVVRVLVRDVARAGEIVDATIASAGDDARVDGVSFELGDETAVRAEARRLAIADARAKAEQLARELGATLGDPIFVEETSVNVPGPVMMRMAADSAESTQVAAGSLEISVGVRVRWAIRR